MSHDALAVRAQHPRRFRCKAFLFDLDGVLVDSRTVVERTWRSWAERHHIDAERLLRVAHGRRTRDTLQAVVPHLDLDSEVAWLDATELADLDGLVAIPGAGRLLAALPAGAWAIVTSGTRRLACRRLEAAGLPIPPVLITSEAVTRGKPAPDGYRLAVECLGQEPAACVAFEDAPPGVAAARGAGTRVVALMTTHLADELAGADVVIRDLAQVSVRISSAGLVATVGAA
ncbi:MAG TPA: HAD-IA family hydrolase [Gemmatimonadales bacterium]|nr:HAD-IA family hydrolase [Gemmatimonadales bacterium]